MTKSLEDSSFSPRASDKESERDDGSSSLKREMKENGETGKKLNKRGRKPKGDQLYIEESIRQIALYE